MDGGDWEVLREGGGGLQGEGNLSRTNFGGSSLFKS